MEQAGHLVAKNRIHSHVVVFRTEAVLERISQSVWRTIHESIGMDDMNMIRHAAAYVLLTSIYGFTYLVSLLGGIIPRRPWKPTGRIMVTGTFHNPGWYLSHLIPLSRSGVKEVILVVDEPQLQLDKIRFICPPKWVAKLLSRAGAKAIWMIIAGLRYRPDLYMGYHFGAGPCSALVAGKLLGRPSCCQMTGGPIVIVGGGVDAIESVGGSLGRPSRFVEALAIRVLRQFELVVVRGNKAKEFLAVHDIEGSVAIITGSVDNNLPYASLNRNIDLIFVGRLSPVKQVHQFIDIVCAVIRCRGHVRAVIVGDGPLRAELQAYTQQLGLVDNVEFLGQQKDVGVLLGRSKIFVLTSKSEGLSIAMAEAMAAGAVPIVADVGELSNLVANGVNGYLIEPNAIDKYVQRAVSLLSDEALWAQFSGRTREASRAHCGVEVVTEKWKQSLGAVISIASGCNPKE